jgi:formate dehydrogenase subunit delta
MTTVEKLVMMANQIAANVMTEDDPPAFMADHIEKFWDPRMKAMLLHHGSAGLSNVAIAAMAQVAASHV